MISKSLKNMAILDESELKFTQNMNEMPKNLGLESKSNSQNMPLATHSLATQENMSHSKDSSSENFQNKNCDENKTETKPSEYQSETRIQLSFSVDRLLNNQLQQKKPPLQPPDRDTSGEKLTDVKFCDDINSGYSCCSLPNCLVNSAPSATCKNLSFQANSYSNSDEDMTTAATVAAANFMDFKSIVRPTPVRAMGNTSEAGKVFISFDC